MWQTDVAKLLQDFYILCIAYQWEGKKMQFIRTRGNDKTLCLAIHALISQADIVVAQNGDSFDIKKINARFAYHGLTPPPSYKTIDTLKILKRHFGLTRNSLDFVCDYFRIGRKMKHQGIDLWDNCMHDPDHKDWKVMEKYNRRDVWLLRQLWLQVLKKWHTTAPKVGLSCPRCGSANSAWKGWEWRGGIKYRVMRCKDCSKRTTTDVKA